MLIFSVKWTVETRYKASPSDDLHLSTAGNDVVIVCGEEDNNQWTITLYNLQTGEERGTTPLERRPDGMTSVFFDYQTCIALSYGYLSFYCW